ncbi:hypothetical protein G6F56_006080 [Rhizopus delemar]|nr:hypothetical protein G6F56_006080 [Rhizopus delemar]
MIREDHPTGVEGGSGVKILQRFMKNYYPPTEKDPEGLQRILYLEPSPDTICTPERIDHVFRLLAQCPLLSQ